MKTPKTSITTKLGRRSRVNLLTLAAMIALPLITAKAADIHWIGPTASYTNAADWDSNSVPTSADNAINANGLANVLQINSGNPDWTVNDISAGGAANASGAIVQNGPTLTVNGWLHIADGLNSVGVYTLNSGIVNVPNGQLFFCESPGAIGTLNINGGTINKSGLGENAFRIADGGWNGSGARTGTVNQVAGTVNCNSEIWMGQTSLGVGLYNLSGSGVINLHNWLAVGRNGGTGIFTMTGGTFNQNDAANGGANFIIGVDNGSYGEFDQSGGTISSTREYWVGQSVGATGVNNISGTASLNVDNWFAIARQGGSGVVNLTGGSITKTGGGDFLIGTGGTGYLNQTGGVLRVNSTLRVGDGSQGNYNVASGTVNVDGDIWVGQGGGANGVLNFSGGTITNHNWLAVGRENATGVLNINGGTYVRSGPGGGPNGPNVSICHGSGPGTVNVISGLIDVSAGDTWIGEDTGTGTWNQNGGTSILSLIHICQNGSASGFLNVNGGNLTATEITTGNTSAGSELNLNGGTILAAGDNLNFIHDVAFVQVQAGGAIFNSQGHSITIPQSLPTSGFDGSGGLTKNGAGTLTLSGANTYTGPTVVNAGKLAIDTTTALGAGNYTVADGADLSLTVEAANAQLNAANLTLGTSAALSLDIDLGAFGNPTSAPINVTGALAVNGGIAINLADGLPQPGQFPLIKYVSKTGSGVITNGLLPVGVGAYISNNVANSSIDLVITNVNLPRWEGLAGGNWDVGVTTNWVNVGDGKPTFFGQGNAVILNDSALGTTTVNLTTTLNPNGVTVNNNTLLYSLKGTGKIGGTAGITKQGSGTLIITNTGGNSYTGPTVISGGAVSVTSLANGGSPSAIGASSASPTNLVLAGGGLSYSGPAVAINRGYSVQADNSSITVASNLTLSGVVTANTIGGLIKSGLAQLAYTTVGTNVLTGASSSGYIVLDGAVRFDGSAGGQTNTIQGGRLGVDGATGLASVLVTNSTVIVGGNVDLGNVADANGSMTVDGNSTLTIGSWLIFNDGGGNTTNTLSLNAGTVNQNNGRLLMGGRPGGTSILNINGGVFNHGGDVFDIADGNWNGPGARLGIVNQTNGTVNCNQQCFIGMQPGGTGIYNLSGGSLFLNDWVVVGRSGGVGFFNMTGGNVTRQNNGQAFIVGSDDGGNSVGTVNQSGGVFTCQNEYWLGVNGGRIGTNNISGTAEFDINNWFSIGRGGLGVINFSGGKINKSSNGNFIIGDGGTGSFTQTGGTNNSDGEIWIGQSGSGVGVYNLSGGAVTLHNWMGIGRESGNGVLNVSGGTFTKDGNGNISIAHNAGAVGTVNISGTGTFINTVGETWVGENAAPATWNMNGGTAVLGLVHLAQLGDGQGLMNLNAGSLTATEITTGNNGAPQRELDFNGGTLVAGADNSNFIHDLSAANVKSGGAIIDTASHSVSVNQALLGVAADGGLTKNGNGTLYLNGANTYTNLTHVNAGALGGVGTILGRVTVASGARLAPGTAAIGTLTVSNVLTLASGSTTAVKVSLDSGVTNDMVVGLSGVNYAGSLVVSNTGTSLLVAGTQFHLFSAATSAGNFTSVTILPAGAGTFNPATGILTITVGSGGLAFNLVKLSGGNLILTGTGGTPNAGYTLLTTTNLAVTLSAWTTNTTGTLDGFGAFSNAIPASTTQPARFFRVRMP